MKKILVLLFCLLPAPAFAGVACVLPFTLTNGTIADATQVMANYNALVTCLGNAASAGINHDITALTGLTTPLSPAQGGSNSYTGGTAAGTNAIVIASTVPSNFSLTTDYKVRFIAGGSNTGATTLSIGSTGVINFYRQTPGGPSPMVGGEIVTGQSVEAVYDGTQYQMTSLPALSYPPGAVFDYAAAAGCPVGSLEATGDATISQTTYPTLFTLLGTTWGAAVGGNFTIPDLRGRTTFSRDSGGSGRVTVGGGNFDGTTVGDTGGQQNHNIAQSNLNNFNFSAGNLLIAGAPEPGCNLAAGNCSSGAALAWVYTSAASAVPSATGATVPSGGIGTALPTLSNAAIVVKCIKG